MSLFGTKATVFLLIGSSEILFKIIEKEIKKNFLILFCNGKLMQTNKPFLSDNLSYLKNMHSLQLYLNTYLFISINRSAVE